jgi:hypothetical protein
VLGVSERDLDALPLDRPALVRVVDLVLGDALLHDEPVGELDRCEDVAAELLVQRGRVADVVAVPVRDGDEVDALGLHLVLRALRVPVQERVDVDALAAGSVEAKRRVTEPGQREICHGNLLSPDRTEPTRAAA